MVKLGSLYRNAPPNQFSQHKQHSLKAKVEFNDRLQEHRLVSEERKEWQRVNSDHGGLQVRKKKENIVLRISLQWSPYYMYISYIIRAT